MWFWLSRGRRFFHSDSTSFWSLRTGIRSLSLVSCCGLSASLVLLDPYLASLQERCWVVLQGDGLKQTHTCCRIVCSTSYKCCAKPLQGDTSLERGCWPNSNFPLLCRTIFPYIVGICFFLSNGLCLFLVEFLIFPISNCSVAKLCGLSATPWTAACQAPLSSTISQSLLKFMSTDAI